MQELIVANSVHVNQLSSFKLNHLDKETKQCITSFYSLPKQLVFTHKLDNLLSHRCLHESSLKWNLFPEVGMVAVTTKVSANQIYSLLFQL